MAIRRTRDMAAGVWAPRAHRAENLRLLRVVLTLGSPAYDGR